MRRNTIHSLHPLAMAFLLVAAMSTTVLGADKTNTITIARGSLRLTVPEDWQRKPPRSRILEHEMVVPPAEGSEDDAGRLTMMAAGGSVKANIERWQGQFLQNDGKPTEKVATKTVQVDGKKVHLVDISGTFMDRRGPFAPATRRENFRMLAAIIETGRGLYFIKFTGPQPTVEHQSDAFEKMVESLRST